MNADELAFLNFELLSLQHISGYLSQVRRKMEPEDEGENQTYKENFRKNGSFRKMKNNSKSTVQSTKFSNVDHERKGIDVSLERLKFKEVMEMKREQQRAQREEQRKLRQLKHEEKRIVRERERLEKKKLLESKRKQRTEEKEKKRVERERVKIEKEKEETEQAIQKQLQAEKSIQALRSKRGLRIYKDKGNRETISKGTSNRKGRSQNIMDKQTSSVLEKQQKKMNREKIEIDKVYRQEKKRADKVKRHEERQFNYRKAHETKLARVAASKHNIQNHDLLKNIQVYKENAVEENDKNIVVNNERELKAVVENVEHLTRKIERLHENKLANEQLLKEIQDELSSPKGFSISFSTKEDKGEI